MAKTMKPENNKQDDLTILEGLYEKLNADYNYIIFESCKMPEEDVDFSEVSNFIFKLNFPVDEQKTFRDFSRGTSFMVLRLQQNSEIDLQKMLDLKSPENFSYYIFRKNRPY
ncbi:MAG: hypothetical protein K9L30_02385 [Desulfobacterales bacterium]|nr:hypothetical protein [Desulfobacterales bacterium]